LPQITGSREKDDVVKPARVAAGGLIKGLCVFKALTLSLVAEQGLSLVSGGTQKSHTPYAPLTRVSFYVTLQYKSSLSSVY